MRCNEGMLGGAPRIVTGRSVWGKLASVALACLAFTLCLAVMPALARAEEGLYGKMSDDGTTLTYYYGDADVVWSNSARSVSVDWAPSKQDASKISRVVFDESAQNFRPVSLRFFFSRIRSGGEAYGRPNLKTIEGLDKINTSACEDMYSIFDGCSSLTSLDLSGWDTSSATEMACMFRNCSSLKSLDLSRWNTSSVRSTGSIFYGCSSLTSLNLSGWDTSSVNDDRYDFGMFNKCSSLKTLQVGEKFKFPKYAYLRSDVLWRSSVDGKAYAASEIPNNVAATYTAEPIDTATMHRLYNPYTGEHFYTASAEEKDHLASIGWRYEGEGWKAPERSDTPVYRLYNSYAGDHHYTTSAEERDGLKAVGWNDEGIGWYSAGDNGVPLYRQYNPYATVGTHNYTTSKEENDGLVAVGWRAEGIGWYGL